MPKKQIKQKTRPRLTQKRTLENRRRHIRRCGLCGRARNLTRTECCNNWICNDADQYVLFSYARNSCYRNHDRYTLCSAHFNEGHKGPWQTCKKCLNSYETEMYVWYSTNEFNFEKLKNPPHFEPTYCAICHTRIALGNGGYSTKGDSYLC